MIEKIVLPLLIIFGGFLYLRYLYKRDKGFLNDKSLLSNVYTSKEWAMGIIVIVAGICFLVKGIIDLFS